MANAAGQSGSVGVGTVHQPSEHRILKCCFSYLWLAWAPGRKDRNKKDLQVSGGDGRGEGGDNAMCGHKIRVSDVVTVLLVSHQLLFEYHIYNSAGRYVLYIVICTCSVFTDALYPHTRDVLGA